MKQQGKICGALCLQTRNQENVQKHVEPPEICNKLSNIHTYIYMCVCWGWVITS